MKLTMSSSRSRPATRSVPVAVIVSTISSTGRRTNPCSGIPISRIHASRLGPFRLGLYACRDWLGEHGAPASLDDLRGRPLVYFVDSMLQVDSLDAARRIVPDMRDALTSTNVFVQVEATRAGAGIGLLPCFMADLHDDLVRLLPDEVDEELDYWAVVRDAGLRQPAVVAVLRALHAQVEAQSARLLGRPG